MSRTAYQYWADCSSPLSWRIYTRDNRSFSKQLPPNAGLGLRYLDPILESELTIFFTSSTEHSSNFSVNEVIEFMLLILWASIALDINFPNSLLAFLVLITLVFGMRSLTSSKHTFPLWESGVPMTTLSGFNKFSIAYPSAKNSGIETTVKYFESQWLFKISTVS